MKQLLREIKHLWEEKTGFKAAAIYLSLIIAVVVLLPFIPLPFSPNELDLENPFQRPFDWNAESATGHVHWLGSDALGRDVLANVLFGARSAFFISFPIMLIASGIGLVLGIGAGYFGDSVFTISRAGLVVACLAALSFFYFGLYLPSNLYSLHFSFDYIFLSIAILIIIFTLLTKVIHPLITKWNFLSSSFPFPVDYLVLRIIEALNSIPSLLLILVIASFLPPSIFLLSILIITVSWTSTARLARAETLRIKQLPYFEAAKSLGVPQKRLLVKHVLPNLLGPVVVSFSFGLAGLLALEATLSFLGIGLPTTFVSWGRTIAGIKSNTSAWWLVAFPGAALALTVLALQTISYHLLNLIQEKKH
ncbi:ABC transporter permease [Pontibacter locisalis]|uniref:ABC transporter permease n=1 Tax=Pontibacter locisalis TaxID=1719035 RepID=A0ABW5IGJ4_9BACT